MKILSIPNILIINPFNYLNYQLPYKIKIQNAIIVANTKQALTIILTVYGKPMSIECL